MIETLASLMTDAGIELPSRRAAAVFGDTPHFGASYTAKELANWNPSQGSADADLLGDLSTLRNRSRDLERNHGIAHGGIQTLVDNIVGTGLRLSAIPDYRALGKDREWSEEWSRNVESLWKSYTDTRECDISGQLNFHGLTTQVFRGALLNGEALALPLWKPGDGRFATKLQLIEADRLSNPDTQMDSEKLRGGVEIDQYGRPLAYWIRNAHPGDVFWLMGAPVGTWTRIPATMRWGRARVIHAHDKERTGQTRGKPILSPVIGQFRMLDHYQRTELQAAVVNAMIAAFIETPLDSASVAEMLGGDISSPQYQSYLQQQNEYVAPLRGAAIIPTLPGQSIKPFLPSRPADAFAPFTEAVIRHIGAGLGLPLELLLKDFSKTNYSSARAALLEAWRFFMGRREWLSRYWCEPVYCLWLEEVINAGLVEAPDFYENQYAYTRSKWTGPGRGWVDPVKEAQAAQIRIEVGLSTLERECAEQGADWEEVLEQRAREQARVEELGVILGKPAINTASDVAPEEKGAVAA